MVFVVSLLVGNGMEWKTVDSSTLLDSRVFPFQKHSISHSLFIFPSNGIHYSLFVCYLQSFLFHLSFPIFFSHSPISPSIISTNTHS